MRHRIMTNFNADSEGITVENIIDKLLENIPEPDEEAYARKAQSTKQAAGPAKGARAKVQQKKQARATRKPSS